MTAIAGLWDAGLRNTFDLLDAMGRRASAHRSRRQILPELEIASGRHHHRPGEGVVSDGGYAIVLDGRLEAADGAPVVEPGRAVIDLYRARGVAGFATLRGEFALALWDPERRRLICARDALGVRPLVFRHSGASFAFASEERGLAPLYGREPLCDLRVAEYLIGLAPPPESGLRASVRRLLPGTAVVIDANGLQTDRFDVLSLPQETTDPPTEQARRFYSLLRDAVARRCAGEDRVDCFLSGGLDSSSIVRLAAAEVPGPIRTLSLVDSARPRLSEQAYIDAAIGGLDVDVRSVEVGDYDPFAGARAALERHAGPVAAPNLLMMRPLYESARDGAVLLDGHGGDEVVSKGVGRLLDLARAGSWFRLYGELRGVADLYGESAPKMLIALYRAFGFGRHKLAGLERAARRMGGHSTPDVEGDDPSDFLSREFRARSQVDAAVAARWTPRPSTGREAEHAVLIGPQQTYALEVLDREAQDAGAEGRCPFWDRALIDYSMSLPTRAKLQDGWTRFILREAMADVLPPEILWRRDKHDFSAQLREGLRRSPIVSLQGLEAARTRLSSHLDVDRVLALRARLDHSEAPVPGQALQALWRIGLWSIWTETADGVAAWSLNAEGRHVPH